MYATDQNVVPQELLDECEELILKVAPEMRMAPLYMMNAPPAMQCVGCSAITSRCSAINAELKNALVASGRWAGNGHIICFCSPLPRDEILGCAIHEAGHLLPFSPPAILDEPASEYRDAKRDLALAKLRSGTTGDVPRLPRWFSAHGHSFVRAALHLHHRAWRAGYEIGLPEVGFSGAHFDTSAPWLYLAAIGGEPRRMLGKTFGEILSRPAPARFDDLFAEDFWAWRERRRVETVNATLLELEIEDEAMSDVLIQITRAENSDKRSAAEDFENVARRLASGSDDPSLAEVRIAMKATGKTAADLANRANYHETRNALRAKLDLAADATADRAELHRQLAAANEDLDRAREIHRRAVSPVANRLTEIEQLSSEASAAKRELRESCDSAELRGKIKLNALYLQGNDQKLREARDAVKRLEKMIGDAKRNAGPSGASAVANLQERLNKARAALSEFETRKAELVAEADRLHDEMIWA